MATRLSFSFSLGLILLLPLLIAGCAPQAPNASKSITVGLSATVTSLDPSVETHSSSGAVQNTILESLARYTPENALEPLLAEKWESVDPTTWRVTLKKGIKFQNGEEFNSDSVKASVNIFNSSKGFAGSWFAFVKEVRPVDAYTVDFITKDPSPIFPKTLAFLYAYPSKYFNDVGADTFGQKPIGTGPYKLVEWVKGDHITVAADPNYRGGKPDIQEITFKTAPEDSTRIAMLQTGKADLVMNVPPSMIDPIEKSGGRVAEIASNRHVFVQINLKDPVLKDVRLRKALNYALDVDALLKTVFSGHASRMKGILFPNMPGYAPDKVIQYTYDPAKAKELMTSAGFPDGFETDLWVGVGRLTLDKELSEALVGQWAKAGIKVNLHQMEWASFTTQLFAGNTPGMHILSHAPVWWDPDFTWQNHFWSQATWKYDNTPEGDAMFEQQRREMDPAKRAALEQQLEKYWLDDQTAWVPLYDQALIYGVSKRLQWTPRPDDLILFNEAKLSN